MAAAPSSSAAPEARSLGLWSLLALGINGIVGVGIFFVPNQIAGLVPGPWGVFAYLLTLLALLPVSLCYAKLGARFDRDGGPYLWACAAFGERAGFVVGFASYASAVLSTAAVLTGLGDYTAKVLGFGAHSRLFSSAAAALFGAVVAAGLRPSAWVWSALTVAKLVPLVLLVTVFLVGRHGAGVSAAPAGTLPWGRAVLLLVFPMQGFEIVPVPGSHVRSPARVIPIATVGSLVLSAGLYALLHWACVSALGTLALADADAPLIAAGGVLGGALLAGLISAGSNVSAIGIGFGMVAMTPRYLSALEARSDSALGALLAEETAQQVPRRALFVTLALVVALVAAGELGRLFEMSSVAVLFQYSVSVLALAVLAFRRQHLLTRWDALWALLALGTLALVARAVERAELLVLGGIIAVGLLLGFVRKRRGA
ncbi:MAG: APC family permease [Pseudomonadota bacterium]